MDAAGVTTVVLTELKETVRREKRAGRTDAQILLSVGALNDERHGEGRHPAPVAHWAHALGAVADEGGEPALPAAKPRARRKK